MIPAIASAPVTTAVTRARAMKYSSRSRASARRASLMRNTAARYADVATNSAPMSSDSGLSQLVTGSPAAMPTGTRPAATARAGGAGAHDGAEKERRQHRRQPERPLGEPAAVEPARRGVEREPGAAQHDAERGQAERNEQRGEDRLERGGEAGPEHDEHEDEPDVVGLPHRTDGPVDQFSRAVAAFAASGGEAPEPAPEARPAEHGLHRHARPQHRGRGVGAAHSAPSDATSAGSSGA